MGTPELNSATDAIANLDPEDLVALSAILDNRQTLIENCSSPEQAVALYRQGEALEAKLRIGRAKFAAQRAELYQTGFLVKALAADLPAQPAAPSLEIRA